MYNFKSLNCNNCNSLVVNLPEEEITKLEGLNFFCECCGYQNILINSKLLIGINKPENTTSIYDLVCFI